MGFYSTIVVQDHLNNILEPSRPCEREWGGRWTTRYISRTSRYHESPQYQSSYFMKKLNKLGKSIILLGLLVSMVGWYEIGKIERKNP